MTDLNQIGRRGAAAGFAAALLMRPAFGFQVPAGQRIACRVMRQGTDIGRAAYTFDQHADQLSVIITVGLKVKLGFITVFTYDHFNTETWQGDQLMGFSSHTNDNGTPRFASARWNGTALAVSGSRTPGYIAPPGALGSSYWHPRTLIAPLINAQDGRTVAHTITPLGSSRALLSNGQSVAANEYHMAGDVTANLWYDTAQVWQGMQYFAHDGSMLTYERL